MAEYRRFVAYVYEYLKGKKENNCGFIKVEEREQQCRIELHLHCPGLPADLPCKIYGFVRKDGLMNGILLEILNTRPDAIEGFIETDSASMNASGISLDQLNGMLFLTESGSFLGTQWDDLPIRPEDFREIKPDHQSDPNVATAEQSEEQSEEPPESPVVLTQQSTEQTVSSQWAVPQGSTVSFPYSLQDSFVPFTDGWLTNAWKIQLNDLRHFPSQHNSLRNNRFIQYGFYNFGHLLLGITCQEQYILGVPGCYNQQESFMAGIFGFSYFRESSQIQLPHSKGGYWYRSVYPPDFH